MPDLTQSLQGRDLGHLRIVAELWDVELSAPDARVGLQRLAPALLEPARAAEVVKDLPSEARVALDDLIQHEGRLPWALFARRYGEVREMGAGRRDRDRPYRKGASPAEALWYRALAARAFFETPSGPEEFAYVPDDLLLLLPAHPEGRPAPLGRPATPAERAHPIPATEFILDDACSFLAALRLGQPVLRPFDYAQGRIAYGVSPPPGFPAPLLSLLASAGLLDPSGLPLPDPTRAFLEARRGEALSQMARAWLHSPTFNELRLLPGLTCEGDWDNDPLRARRAILDFLSTVARDPWWSLPAFVADVRQRHPDFQRPAGDYDSWFIRSEASGEFLRGFAHWDEVDGALIRYIITGPLHCLGVLDLAAPAPGAPPAAFRCSAWAGALLSGNAPEGLPIESERLKVGSDARLRVPRLAPRAARYQIARFCEWDEPDPAGDAVAGAYRYRLTPASLERARQQGLTVGQLLSLLRRHAGAVPPSLAKALERWEQRGTEARVEAVSVLRLASPELLQAVRRSRAARFLGDPLGPTAVIVKGDAAEKVLAVLAEMGYLGEGKVESGE